MRDAVNKFETQSKRLTREQQDLLFEIKERGMERVFKILVSHLGWWYDLGGTTPDDREPTFNVRIPVLADNKKDVKLIDHPFTPQDFSKQFIGYDPKEFVVLSKNTFPNSLVPPCSSGKLSEKQYLKSLEFRKQVRYFRF